MSPDGELAFNPVRRSGVPAVAVTRLSGASLKVKEWEHGHRCSLNALYVAWHHALVAAAELDQLPEEPAVSPRRFWSC